MPELVGSRSCTAPIRPSACAGYGEDVSREFVVSLPHAHMMDRLGTAPKGIRFVVWSVSEPSPEPRIDLLVLPYAGRGLDWDRLRTADIGIIQSQAIGYGKLEKLLPPGVTFCNAAGVHETSTAELAVTLTLASLRGIPDFVRRQDRGEWDWVSNQALADKTVLVVGQGGVGRATVERLAPFEAEIVRVATTDRDDEWGHVHGIGSLSGLLPDADVVILALPHTASTEHLVDDRFLTQMKDGALLVNVGRGPVVDTDALIEHAERGRLTAALDVMDPEPLPPDHPLWHTPGVLITPHVGGNSTAMAPRIDRLVRKQLARLLSGDEPLNVVFPR